MSFDMKSFIHVGSKRFVKNLDENLESYQSSRHFAICNARKKNNIKLKSQEGKKSLEIFQKFPFWRRVIDVVFGIKGG